MRQPGSDLLSREPDGEELFDCGAPKPTLKRLRNPARAPAASRYDSGVFAIPFSEPVEKVGRD